MLSLEVVGDGRVEGASKSGVVGANGSTGSQVLSNQEIHFITV